MALSLDSTGKVDNVKTVVDWEIENVRLINKKVGEVLSSPEFLVNNKKWQIHIYPNGYSQDFEGYVSVALQSLSQEYSKELILIISFANYCNKILFSCMECVTFTAEHNFWKSDQFTRYDEFLRKLNNVSPDNKLKIKCELLPQASDFSNVHKPLNFENFFNSETHSDVKFSVKDRVLFAHKVILSNKSKFYAAMFEHPMKENVENVVHVEDVEYEVFAEMLRFIYSGRVKNMKSNVKSLLIAADKYAIDDLKLICDECLCGNLSVDNVVEYLELADTYNVKALRSRAINFILSNAKTLIDIPSFKSIVDLRGDLVFELFRCLVQDKNKTDKVDDNSKETLLKVNSFRFGETTSANVFGIANGSPLTPSALNQANSTIAAAIPPPTPAIQPNFSYYMPVDVRPAAAQAGVFSAGRASNNRLS